MAVLGSKLYLAWEFFLEVGDTLAAVYDGSTSWTWASTNNNGLNVGDYGGPASFYVFNSKLYVTWIGSLFTFTRVAVYNGNDSAPSWSMAGGTSTYGLNKDWIQNSPTVSTPRLVAFNSKLYATWSERVFGGGSKPDAIRAAVYNGNDSAPSWSFVDGNGYYGLNYDSSQSANDPVFAVFNSTLYLAWWEMVGGTQSVIRLAAYNGNDSSPAWTFADGSGVDGLNFNPARSAFSPQLSVFGSKLYMTWLESDANGVTQVRAYRVY